MSERNCIEFKDIRYCYEEVCAVEHISFDVPKNTFTALVGPNGGGKSTLLKLLTGLLKPDKGSIVVKDSALVGYVPQENGFDRTFPMTVFELVLSGTLSRRIRPFTRYSKQQREKAGDALLRTGLSGFEKRGIDQLSAGQLKRAVIARALASDADIIVLDEPDSSLDIGAAKELYSILKKLKQDKTIIAASHHVEDVLELADKAIYVNKTVTQYEEPEELKRILKKGIII